MLQGCCVNMLPRTEHLAGIEYIESLARMGYDYIEIPLKLLERLEEAEFEALRRELERCGLPCRCCNDFMPASFQIVGEDCTPQHELNKYLKHAFSRMEKLQVPYTVFGSPWSRKCPDGFEYDRAWSQIVDFLRVAGEMAVEHGMILTIEHNNHTETNMMNHFADTATMALEVNHPGVQLMCDYYHLRVENESPDILLKYSHMLHHTHISRLKDRTYFYSLEGEEEHIRHYADILKQIGYNGGVSIEGKVPSHESWEEQAPMSLAQLRQVLG